MTDEWQWFYEDIDKRVREIEGMRQGRIIESEWYPVLELRPVDDDWATSRDPAVEVPLVLLTRYMDATRAFAEVQRELKGLLEENA